MVSKEQEYKKAVNDLSKKLDRFKFIDDGDTIFKFSTESDSKKRLMAARVGIAMAMFGVVGGINNLNNDDEVKRKANSVRLKMLAREESGKKSAPPYNKQHWHRKKFALDKK